MSEKACPGYNGNPAHIADLEAFGKDKSQLDGHAVYCKNCRFPPLTPEDPEFVGDLMERCRALSQKEIQRLELGRSVTQTKERLQSIQALIEILCKLKMANIGTINDDLSNLSQKQLETLRNGTITELESRRQALKSKQLNKSQAISKKSDYESELPTDETSEE
jgi:hypothetical protein